MIEWLQYAATLIGGAVGGAALYDRWLRHRYQITGEIDVLVLPGTVEVPGSDPWDPPQVDESFSDGIIITATIHNNTAAPVVVKEWRVKGPPFKGPLHVKNEIIEPGETGTASTMLVPDWEGWDQRLESGFPSRGEPWIRCSLIALSRASSRRLTLRSPRYSIPDATVRNNVVRAKRTSEIT